MKNVFKNKKRKVIISGIFFAFLILGVSFYYFPKWLKSYRMRTHFYNADKKLDSITEEKVIENIKGQCDKIRKSAGKLYSPREIETAIKNSDGKNKIRLVGREEASKKGYLALNIEGKDVELFCFDFGERVVIEGRGKIEIGFADFHDIDGNALSLTGG